MELALLALLLVVVLAVVAVVGFCFFLFKLVLWVVFLPLKLLFKLIFGGVGTLLGGFRKLAGVPFSGLALLIAALVVPVVIIAVLLAAAVAVIGTLIGLVVPAIPFVLLGLLIWAVARRSSAVRSVPA